MGALASANLWRILVSFLVQTLVARRLGFDAVGQYTVAMAFLNICQVLCEMGLPLWMVRELAHAPQLRRAYFRHALLLEISSALLLWVILAALLPLLPYPQETLTAIFWVGASLPLFAVSSATATIFQAAERLDFIFVADFVTNLLILLLSLWLLWQRRGVAELLLVVVLSQGIGMFVALAILFTRRLFSAPQTNAPLNLRSVVKGVSPFFGLSLTDVLLQRLDILLLSFFGGARLLGAYSAAYNLVRAAIKLLQSVWRGIYPTLARLHPTSPAQANKLASRLLYLGFTLCVLGALMVNLLTGPILHLVYGANGGAEGGADIGIVAIVLSWLVWQAPLYFLELYATTWLMVIVRAGAAFGLALLHVLLLTLLLPIGASFAGVVGAAWGTVASQAIAATITLWYLRRAQAQTSPIVR